MTIEAQRNWLAACLALAVVACSGNASQPGQSAGAGGALSAGAGDAGAGALEASAAGAAGSAEANEEGGAGGAAGAGEAPQLRAGSPSGGSAAAGAGTAGVEAGAGGVPSPVIPSGTHLCYGADDCVGPVECRGKESSSIQVCLKSCATDDDCSANHRCVLPGGPLRPDAAGCFLRCEDSPLICPYAFDCYDLSGQQDYTCLPRQW